MITVYRINQTDPEATPIPVKTFTSSGPLSVMVIGDEHSDSAKIIKKDENGTTAYDLNFCTHPYQWHHRIVLLLL